MKKEGGRGSVATTPSPRTALGAPGVGQKEKIRTAPTAVVWTVTGGLVARCDRQGFRFIACVQATFGIWHVLGLVTPIPEDGASLDTVLSNHAHQNLGEHVDLFEAQKIASQFLETAPVPERCACPEVSPP